MSLISTPRGRSKLEAAAFTAVLMIFFFAVGLAGGAFYLMQAPGSEPQLADSATTTPSFDATAQRLAQVQPTARPPDTVPNLPPDTPIAPAFERAAMAAPAASSEPAPVAFAATQASRTLATPGPSAKPVSPNTADRTKSITSRQVAALRPPPMPAHGTGAYRVQFGAFASEENARRIQWAIEATGMAVDVTHAPNSAGRVLYTLRSPRFPDPTAAQAAADVVKDKVSRFVNPLPIEYAIMSDTAE